MDNELFEIENIEKKDEVEVITLPVLFLALQMEFPFVRLTTFFRQTSIISKCSTLLRNTYVLHARSKEGNRQFPVFYGKSRDPNESTLLCHVIAQARKKRDNGGRKS